MNKYLLPVAVIASLLFWSCENNKSGNVDPNWVPPLLVATAINHSSFNLDSVSTNYVDSLGKNRYRIYLQINALAIEPASAPMAILRLYKPKAASPFAKYSFDGNKTGTDSIIYVKNIEFDIQRSDIGTFRLEFYLQSSAGSISNSMMRSFIVTRRNSPPKILSVSMPDSLTIGHIPSPDSAFLLSAAVSDSDGISDIELAGFYSIKPDGSTGNCGNSIQLYDDGSQRVIFPPDFRSGDRILGDGVYSFRIPLLTRVKNSCNPPPDSVNTQRGDYTFVFFATDKSGAESDTVQKVIRVK